MIGKIRRGYKAHQLQTWASAAELLIRDGEIVKAAPTRHSCASNPVDHHALDPFPLRTITSFQQLDHRQHQPIFSSQYQSRSAILGRWLCGWSALAPIIKLLCLFFPTSQAILSPTCNWPQSYNTIQVMLWWWADFIPPMALGIKVDGSIDREGD